MNRPTEDELAWMARALQAMATPACLVALRELEKGEATVSALMAVTGLSQSALSHKLARMRRCGLVCSRAEWPTMLYRLHSPQVMWIIRLAAASLHQEADHL